jgi:hypothetical protein
MVPITGFPAGHAAPRTIRAFPLAVNVAAGVEDLAAAALVNLHEVAVGGTVLEQDVVPGGVNRICAIRSQRHPHFNGALVEMEVVGC